MEESPCLTTAWCHPSRIIMRQMVFSLREAAAKSRHVCAHATDWPKYAELLANPELMGHVEGCTRTPACLEHISHVTMNVHKNACHELATKELI